MIKGFRHKGLKLLFETGKASGVNPNHARRIKNILALLETAETVDDMNLPGMNLHELKGKRKATWALKITGNWRITFQLFEGNIFEVNYEDYHQ